MKTCLIIVTVSLSFIAIGTAIWFWGHYPNPEPMTELRQRQIVYNRCVARSTDTSAGATLADNCSKLLDGIATSTATSTAQ